MSKKLFALLFVMLMLCGAALADGITVTDMHGREIALDQPATRIVALTPSDCEILCAIGCEDTLVGRGTMFMTPTKYPKQKVVVVGPDGRDTRVEKPSTPNNPDAKYDAVVSNSGLRSVDHFGRALPKVAFIA